MDIKPGNELERLINTYVSPEVSKTEHTFEMGDCVNFETLDLSVREFKFLNNKINVYLPSSYAKNFKILLEKLENNLDSYEIIKNDEINKYGENSIDSQKLRMQDHITSQNLQNIFNDMESQINMKSFIRDVKINKILE